MIAAVSVGIAGHESTVDVPFTLQSDPRRLSATGSMELRQTDLGLAPYSLMLGALQVQDAMTVKFKIVLNCPRTAAAAFPRAQPGRRPALAAAAMVILRPMKCRLQ